MSISKLTLDNSMQFATNQELIGELMKRQTFAGIIISSTEEHKNNEQTHNDFAVYSAACNEDTISILSKIILELKATK
jgi:hypothetical protein